MISKLFELRGELTARQSLVLSIIGVCLLLLVWAGLARLLSKERVTQIDVANMSEVQNKKYYSNDSLMIEDLDILLAMEESELSQFGLRKERVFSALPTPLKVFESFKELHEKDFLIYNSLKSIWLNLLGYLVAIGLAIPLGFLLAMIPLFRGLFSKIFDALRFIPLTAVTGIFVMWLGLDSEMKVAFLAFGILVYLVPVVVQRIDEVQTVYLRTVFTLGATNWQTIKSVYLPSVLSRLFDDIRVLTAISWTYITIAEMLNKSGGIGELIWVAKRQSRIDKAFAVLIVIVLIGIFQDRLFKWLDRLLFPYKHLNSGKKY